MYLPYTALEATLIGTFLLAFTYYVGHHFGVKQGALGMFEFLKQNGQIEIEEEIVEYDDEDGDNY